MRSEEYAVAGEKGRWINDFDDEDDDEHDE